MCSVDRNQNSGARFQGNSARARLTPAFTFPRKLLTFAMQFGTLFRSPPSGVAPRSKCGPNPLPKTPGKCQQKASFYSETQVPSPASNFTPPEAAVGPWFRNYLGQTRHARGFGPSRESPGVGPSAHHHRGLNAFLGRNREAHPILIFSQDSRASSVSQR